MWLLYFFASIHWHAYLEHINFTIKKKKKSVCVYIFLKWNQVTELCLILKQSGIDREPTEIQQLEG